ncbi:MAG: pyruvate carboxylase [Deltaproteobacteria bacterium]|jgi:pyruvate carboxylase|nr:pyruvate carboxylase [Deltaproteobacteria bacterium]
MTDFNSVLRQLKGQPILVANRGISGRRICRAIRDRFEGVAVMTATDVDKTAPAASSAQELLLLGSDPQAYLDLELIIELAVRRGCIAIHPGWGFASEDARFPALCEKAGITFIGSAAESMNLLGNKVEVRKLARSLGIPVVPGSEGAVDIPQAEKAVAALGLPVMLKAEGGGGGRGIIPVHSPSELEDAFRRASALAQASFRNPRLYVEKLLEDVRHIEIQVAADRFGNIFCFDERDCTIQRSHQKLVEITPSPWAGMTPELRERLKGYARALVDKVGYSSLCTVEFLVTRQGEPFMIEVNTRLQVEHGITEVRHGVDLVEDQIAIAFGAELREPSLDHEARMCAMQVRINMEDPQDDFTPNSGLITRYVSPGGPGVRLDSNLSAGYDFPSNYDSAGSLLISYGQDWTKTLGVMERALSEYTIAGVKNTIPFYRKLLKAPSFRAAEFTTSFIDDNPDLLEYTESSPESERLGRLAAEITAHGYNPYVQLGRYRSADSPRLGAFVPVLPRMRHDARRLPGSYPKGDRKALLDFIRDSGEVHFTDTTCRDMTQSNSGNRFRLAEDALVGPYLDEAGLFSLETGGGAHFHVAMLANMTYPFTEAAHWNGFAPKTHKQILVRSTNILGYKPQPAALMRETGEMIARHFSVVRCFDFLNHAANMKPFAEVIMSDPSLVFQPALSLSYGKGFTVGHYLEAADAIISMCASASGIPKGEIPRHVILGLKDMAGACPPRFIKALVEALRKAYPEIVLQYHRHYTDGLFVPAVGAAALAGCQILDVALGASVRSYGQGDILATAAYVEEELGLPVRLDRAAVRSANFVLKQIMPWYDRYAPTFFRGIDHDVTGHGMPGGATSSSQEGAMKQGYIQFLPHMLRYLAGLRKITRYHDVTPGSQITWNTAFLAVSSAFQRGGPSEVARALEVLERAADFSEAREAALAAGLPAPEPGPELARDRLLVYHDANDAFRDLLLGKFGPLPLGFPEDWVYESAFGPEKWKEAVISRREDSPLNHLEDPDLAAERAGLKEFLRRDPTDEEFVMYLNQPSDALNTFRFRQRFGDPNCLPLDVWFEGLRQNRPTAFLDSVGKPHQITVFSNRKPDEDGVVTVRYFLDSQIMTHAVQVGPPSRMDVPGRREGPAVAQDGNPYHVGAPMNGDLWVMYVREGDIVREGQELFNIAIMKQEKAVRAKTDGLVKKVHKFADFENTKEMVPVKAGELIVELGPVPDTCSKCGQYLPLDQKISYCPYCGGDVSGLSLEDGGGHGAGEGSTARPN